MEKIYRRWKLIVGENSSTGKNICHFTEILSLFPGEVFPDKVPWNEIIRKETTANASIKKRAI